MVAVGKIDDGVQFFREHALKSVWKPIIAFHRELADEQLVYKTVQKYRHWNSFLKSFLFRHFLVVISNQTVAWTSSYLNHWTIETRDEYFNNSLSYWTCLRWKRTFNVIKTHQYRCSSKALLKIESLKFHLFECF